MSKLKLLLLAVAAVAVVVVVLFGVQTLNRGPQPQTANPAGTPQGGGAPQGVKVNEGGGVGLSVRYSPEATAKSGLITFEVEMNTHSVELGDFDLSKLSAVTLTPGGTLSAAQWTPVGAATGHHVAGTLTFEDPKGWLPAAGTVGLEVRKLAGVASRRFEWSKP